MRPSQVLSHFSRVLASESVAQRISSASQLVRKKPDADAIISFLKQHEAEVPSLGEAVELVGRSIDTPEHIAGVSIATDLLARRLGLDEEARELVVGAAVWHDIGKAAIPREILDSTERLSDEQFRIMALHAIRGAQILYKEGAPIEYIETALMHHESQRAAARGYLLPPDVKPTYLSKIVQAADVYDATRASRVYKTGFPLYKRKGFENQNVAGIMIGGVNIGEYPEEMPALLLSPLRRHAQIRDPIIGEKPIIDPRTGEPIRLPNGEPWPVPKVLTYVSPNPVDVLDKPHAAFLGENVYYDPLFRSLTKKVGDEYVYLGSGAWLMLAEDLDRSIPGGIPALAVAKARRNYTYEIARMEAAARLLLREEKLSFDERSRFWSIIQQTMRGRLGDSEYDRHLSRILQWNIRQEGWYDPTTGEWRHVGTGELSQALRYIIQEYGLPFKIRSQYDPQLNLYFASRLYNEVMQVQRLRQAMEKAMQLPGPSVLGRVSLSQLHQIAQQHGQEVAHAYLSLYIPLPEVDPTAVPMSDPIVPSIVRDLANKFDVQLPILFKPNSTATELAQGGLFGEGVFRDPVGFIGVRGSGLPDIPVNRWTRGLPALMDITPLLRREVLGPHAIAHEMGHILVGAPIRAQWMAHISGQNVSREDLLAAAIMRRVDTWRGELEADAFAMLAMGDASPLLALRYIQFLKHAQYSRLSVPRSLIVPNPSAARASYGNYIVIGDPIELLVTSTDMLHGDEVPSTFLASVVQFERMIGIPASSEIDQLLSQIQPSTSVVNASRHLAAAESNIVQAARDLIDTLRRNAPYSSVHPLSPVEQIIMLPDQRIFSITSMIGDVYPEAVGRRKIHIYPDRVVWADTGEEIDLVDVASRRVGRILQLAYPDVVEQAERTAQRIMYYKGQSAQQSARKTIAQRARQLRSSPIIIGSMDDTMSSLSAQMDDMVPVLEAKNRIWNEGWFGKHVGVGELSRGLRSIIQQLKLPFRLRSRYDKVKNLFFARRLFGRRRAAPLPAEQQAQQLLDIYRFAESIPVNTPGSVTLEEVAEVLRQYGPDIAEAFAAIHGPYSITSGIPEAIPITDPRVPRSLRTVYRRLGMTLPVYISLWGSIDNAYATMKLLDQQGVIGQMTLHSRWRLDIRSQLRNVLRGKASLLGELVTPRHLSRYVYAHELGHMLFGTSTAWGPTALSVLPVIGKSPGKIERHLLRELARQYIPNTLQDELLADVSGLLGSGEAKGLIFLRYATVAHDISKVPGSSTPWAKKWSAGDPIPMTVYHPDLFYSGRMRRAYRLWSWIGRQIDQTRWLTSGIETLKERVAAANPLTPITTLLERNALQELVWGIPNLSAIADAHLSLINSAVYGLQGFLRWNDIVQILGSYGSRMYTIPGIIGGAYPEHVGRKILVYPDRVVWADTGEEIDLVEAAARYEPRILPFQHPQAIEHTRKSLPQYRKLRERIIAQGRLAEVHKRVANEGWFGRHVGTGELSRGMRSIIRLLRLPFKLRSQYSPQLNLYFAQRLYSPNLRDETAGYTRQWRVMQEGWFGRHVGVGELSKGTRAVIRRWGLPYKRRSGLNLLAALIGSQASSEEVMSILTHTLYRLFGLSTQPPVVQGPDSVVSGVYDALSLGTQYGLYPFRLYTAGELSFIHSLSYGGTGTPEDFLRIQKGAVPLEVAHSAAHYILSDPQGAWISTFSSSILPGSVVDLATEADVSTLRSMTEGIWLRPLSAESVYVHSLSNLGSSSHFNVRTGLRLSVPMQSQIADVERLIQFAAASTGPRPHDEAIVDVASSAIESYFERGGIYQQAMREANKMAILSRIRRTLAMRQRGRLLIRSALQGPISMVIAETLGGPVSGTAGDDLVDLINKMKVLPTDSAELERLVRDAFALTNEMADLMATQPKLFGGRRLVSTAPMSRLAEVGLLLSEKNVRGLFDEARVQRFYKAIRLLGIPDYPLALKMFPFLTRPHYAFSVQALHMQRLREKWRLDVASRQGTPMFDVFIRRQGDQFFFGLEPTSKLGRSLIRLVANQVGANTSKILKGLHTLVLSRQAHAREWVMHHLLGIADMTWEGIEQIKPDPSLEQLVEDVLSRPVGSLNESAAQPYIEKLLGMTRSRFTPSSSGAITGNIYDWVAEQALDIAYSEKLIRAMAPYMKKMRAAPYRAFTSILVTEIRNRLLQRIEEAIVSPKPSASPLRNRDLIAKLRVLLSHMATMAPPFSENQLLPIGASLLNPSFPMDLTAGTLAEVDGRLRLIMPGNYEEWLRSFYVQKGNLTSIVDSMIGSAFYRAWGFGSPQTRLYYRYPWMGKYQTMMLYEVLPGEQLIRYGRLDSKLAAQVARGMHLDILVGNRAALEGYGVLVSNRGVVLRDWLGDIDPNLDIGTVRESQLWKMLSQQIGEQHLEQIIRQQLADPYNDLLIASISDPGRAKRLEQRLRALRAAFGVTHYKKPTLLDRLLRRKPVPIGVIEPDLREAFPGADIESLSRKGLPFEEEIRRFYRSLVPTRKQILLSAEVPKLDLSVVRSARFRADLWRFVAKIVTSFYESPRDYHPVTKALMHAFENIRDLYRLRGDQLSYLNYEALAEDIVAAYLDMEGSLKHYEQSQVVRLNPWDLQPHLMAEDFAMVANEQMIVKTGMPGGGGPRPSPSYLGVIKRPRGLHYIRGRTIGPMSRRLLRRFELEARVAALHMGAPVERLAPFIPTPNYRVRPSYWFFQEMLKQTQYYDLVREMQGVQLTPEMARGASMTGRGISEQELNMLVRSEQSAKLAAERLESQLDLLMAKVEEVVRAGKRVHFLGRDADVLYALATRMFPEYYAAGLLEYLPGVGRDLATSASREMLADYLIHMGVDRGDLLVDTGYGGSVITEVHSAMRMAGKPVSSTFLHSASYVDPAHIRLSPADESALRPDVLTIEWLGDVSMAAAHDRPSALRRMFRRLSTVVVNQVNSQNLYIPEEIVELDSPATRVHSLWAVTFINEYLRRKGIDPDTLDVPDSEEVLIERLKRLGVAIEGWFDPNSGRFKHIGAGERGRALRWIIKLLRIPIKARSKYDKWKNLGYASQVYQFTRKVLKNPILGMASIVIGAVSALRGFSFSSDSYRYYVTKWSDIADNLAGKAVASLVKGVKKAGAELAEVADEVGDVAESVVSASESPSKVTTVVRYIPSSQVVTTRVSIRSAPPSRIRREKTMARYAYQYAGGSY